MALIASISGIRGTLGGPPGENLTPQHIVAFAAAYGSWLKTQSVPHKVVLGRDARPSGPMLTQLVAATLQALGLEVLDLGLTTTPTTEMAVTHLQAGGGIILTASHNPVEWNALKLLNERGEFVSAADGKAILNILNAQQYSYVPVAQLGEVHQAEGLLEHHIETILAHPLVNTEAIRTAKFRVGVDAVNSSGGVALPALLERLGVAHVECINCEPNGVFAHNPEPLAIHLMETCARVRDSKLDLCLVVDPDVDRLALIDEKGQMIGEEYTLVGVADYVLGKTPGPVVNNLSSSRALYDIAQQHGVKCTSAAVGEVNVVAEMKAQKAVLGGEGNGGVIVPDLHYGRDALIGAALFLALLAERQKPLSELRATWPSYFMAKGKIPLNPQLDFEQAAEKLKAAFPEAQSNTVDGLKLDLPQGWIHVRKSNTEPILRVYTEAGSQAEADKLAQQAQDAVLG